MLDESRMTPLLPNKIGNVPWHSNQYAALPKIYVQNASLEIAWVSVIKSIGTISGESVMPYISTGMEGFDINSPEELIVAVRSKDVGDVVKLTYIRKGQRATVMLTLTAGK